MSLSPSPQPLLNLGVQHHHRPCSSRRRCLRNRRFLQLELNRQHDKKMQSQSSTSSTSTNATASASRGQPRQMTSTPVTQPCGDFTGLNGLIRAALVEDSAIAVAAASAAAAAAASSPQFQLPSSMGSSQMQPPPPPLPVPPVAHKHPYRHPHPFQAVPISTISVPTSSTASAWPEYLPLGRGLGCMNTNPDVGHSPHHTSSIPCRIPTPCNRSQLSLYRVLEHANLLEYFETFIALGGDDVQQLVDADEEEFLEIMSLVGMTQKPLHVRRLQKTLLKWRQDRRFFQLNGPLSSRYAHYKHYNNPVKYILPFNHVVSEQELDSGQDSSMDQSQSSSSHQQYLAPRDVIKGAPKRPRLMDNLMKRSGNQECDAATTAAITTDTEADESEEVEVEDVVSRRN